MLNKQKRLIKFSITTNDLDQKTIFEKLEDLYGSIIRKISKVLKRSKIIVKYSKKYNVDPKLVESILIVESGKNINAKSNGGAVGIAQIKTSTAKYMGIDNINNPENNIHASVKYLAYLKTKFNNDVDSMINKLVELTYLKPKEKLLSSKISE